MASPRVVSQDRKSDDLEIVSVGALYSGSSWDKKYWSSSRGKDRFPYPVGYKAVRDHNGNTYYMEIEEGAKGPLFLIRYLDESWTGQTPDIAWGKFQKTGFSHLKIWHGKRFACKMNGMEFFGFKNPLVQRLLRELVTNSHGMLETSSISRASQIRANDETPAMCANPNLLYYLDMPVARKKRSRKPGMTYQNSIVKDGHKKQRFQDSLSGGEILNSAAGPIFSVKEEVETVGLKVAPPEQLHASHATNENTSLPSEKPPPVKVVTPIQEIDPLPGSCKSKPLSNFSEELHGLQEKETKPNDDIFLHESQNMTGTSLCAPDSFDFQQDNNISSAPKNDDDTSCEQREELTLANMVVGEGLLAEPDAEDLADSTLILTSKNSDSDSADQDTVKSMMSFLLPQAIPLLKKFSCKKPPKNYMSDNCKTSQLDDASGTVVSLSIRKPSEDDENMQVAAPDPDQDFASNVAIAPDSFDEPHLDGPRSGHIISSSKEAYPADLPKIPVAEEHVAIVNDLSVSALTTTEIIGPSSHDVSTIVDENIQDQYLKKSMSIPQCNSSSNMILSQESKELSAEDGNLLQTEHYSENKEPKSTVCCSTEGTGFVVGTTPTEVGSVKKEKHKVYSRKRVSINQQKRNRNSSSESENSCRNTGGDDSVRNMSPVKIPRLLEIQPTLSTNSESNRTNPRGNESGHVTEKYQGPELVKVDNNTLLSVKRNEALQQDMRSAHAFGNGSISPSSFPASKVEDFQANTGEACGIQVSEPPFTNSQYKENTSEKSTSVLESPASPNLKLNRDVKINNEMEKTAELLGCYFHPMPVSSVLLKSVGNEIYICVFSFATEDRVSTLFMYKISAKAPSKGFPSVIGHTSVKLPIVDDKSGGNRTLERSYFHFTPDGEHLVFTGNIKTPYCRKRDIDCSCLTCTTACFEENAVRIVQVKTGHVSLVTKLQADDSVQCVVVCDPNYLIVAVKSGNLIVWDMNSHWRGPAEEFVTLANPCISSCIVELKKIPKCPHLVIGHNGIGEFTIWDISKRSLVSRFVSPSKMIFEFIPSSLFAWHPIYSHSTMEDHIDMILAATKLWFSKGIDNKTLVPAEVKDTAIWLLVSTDLDSNPKCDGVESPARCWRVALLVKDQVILGSQLDPRASAVGTVSGHGVAGTLDGLVYLWDLSTGAKLGFLHDFKGQRVSCISTDDSKNICIASEDGQLLVYCNPEK
ncbi:PREDICTED: uncharacterized protein LOC104756910 [Camelina sativa]|uniref:Uncharacterized protein LOC104756910 n=1 Tax=Camelina sativa TaxID=90675 RepID=A0ABM0WY80_CAMSA|nr:PREDICTED: uncharacterized protein LOC104756910 [Camelina sativa]